MEVKASLEESTAAMLRAREWAENPVDDPVLDFEQGAGPEFSAYHWAHYAYEIVNTDTNINFRDEWVSTTAYAFRDSVMYGGSCFYCHTGNTNQPPNALGDNQYWGRMALRGDDGSASSLTIGAVTTGTPGTAAAATITGNPPVQQLNLTIPAGESGVSPDMSNYYNRTDIDNMLDADFDDYYTKEESDARFEPIGEHTAGVGDIRLSGSTSFVNSSGTFLFPAGCVLTMLGDFGADDGYGNYSAIQKLVNNVWVTIVGP